MRLNFVYFIFLFLLLFSCVSGNDEIVNSANKNEVVNDTVYDLKIIRTDDTSMYESKNKNSDQLLIYIEGSGLNSVLGERENGIWRSFQFSYYICNFFRDKCNILIPEKLKMDVGENYENDKEIISLYTVENMVNSYCKSVDFYLDGHDFSTVILFGVSEGGLLAPKIYDSLRSKHKINKMIIWGSGGLSQYECFKKLGNAKINMPESYRGQCLDIDKYYEDINKYPQSTDKFYLGWPYKRWNSFFNYKPIDYLSKIEIPILFIQGEKDFSSPVESVEFVQNNLNKTNFFFKYYEDMGHIPESDKEINKIMEYINGWEK